MVTVREWLASQATAPEIVEVVVEVVQSVSFKGAGVADAPASLAAAVVQDADRLDAIGAIGIARAFSYGGHHGRPLYDDKQPTMHQSFEDYKQQTSSTVAHFYEKLSLLKDRMHTQPAQQLALERHEFMVSFLQRLCEEAGGQA